MFKRTLITSLALSLCSVAFSSQYVSAQPQQILKLADLNINIGNIGGGSRRNRRNRVSNDILETVLLQHGLQEMKDCKIGAIKIIVSQNNSRCAFPTSQYPGGLYKLTDNYSLLRVGTAGNTSPVQNSGTFQTGPGVVVQPGHGTFQTGPGVIVQPGHGILQTGPGPIHGTTVSAGGAQWPSIIDSAVPNAPVPPHVTLNIQNMLGRRNVQLMPFCPTNFNAVPSALFIVNNRYTACAYPSLSFPAGRYAIDSHTPF